MPDSFEKALEAAILHGKANGGVENEDTLNVIFALKQTLTAQLDAIHNEVRTNREAVVELFDKHCVTYIHMTPSQFETWVGKYAADRDLSTRKMIDLSEAHRRSGDVAGSDHMSEREMRTTFLGPREESEESRQHWFMWLTATTVGKVLIYVLGGVLLWWAVFAADKLAN